MCFDGDKVTFQSTIRYQYIVPLNVVQFFSKDFDERQKIGGFFPSA